MNKTKIIETPGKKVSIDKSQAKPKTVAEPVPRIKGAEWGLIKVKNALIDTVNYFEGKISTLTGKYNILDSRELDHYAEIKNEIESVRETHKKDLKEVYRFMQNGNQSLDEKVESVDDKLDEYADATDKRLLNMEEQYTALFKEAGDALAKAKSDLEAKISGVDEIFKNALADNMMEVDDKVAALEKKVANNTDDYKTFIEQNYKSLENYVMNISDRLARVENTNAESILGEFGAIDAYLKMASNQVQFGKSLELRRKFYKVDPVNANTVRIYEKGSEVKNILDSPEHVYEDISIELPGEHADLHVIDFVYKTPEGIKFRIPVEVDAVEVKNNKTTAGIKKLVVPDKVEKYGIGISNYALA